MKKFIILAVLLFTGTAFAETPGEIIETGQAAWTALLAGKWCLGLGLAITAAVSLFRAPWMGGLVEEIPPRWRTAIPLALSGIASALLALAGGMPGELIVVAWPAMAGVSLGAHEVTEMIRGARRRKLQLPLPPPPRPHASASSIFMLLLLVALSGCSLKPPAGTLYRYRLPAAGSATETDSAIHIQLIKTEDTTFRRWCAGRQKHRWWFSTAAQVAGVLTLGLAGSALARNDDNVELGLELGSLTFSAIAAGAQTYSGHQASAYEKYCSGT